MPTGRARSDPVPIPTQRRAAPPRHPKSEEKPFYAPFYVRDHGAHIKDGNEASFSSTGTGSMEEWTASIKQQQNKPAPLIMSPRTVLVGGFSDSDSGAQETTPGSSPTGSSSPGTSRTVRSLLTEQMAVATAPFRRRPGRVRVPAAGGGKGWGHGRR